MAISECKSCSTTTSLLYWIVALTSLVRKNKVVKRFTTTNLYCCCIELIWFLTLFGGNTDSVSNAQLHTGRCSKIFSSEPFCSFFRFSVNASAAASIHVQRIVSQLWKEVEKVWKTNKFWICLVDIRSNQCCCSHIESIVFTFDNTLSNNNNVHTCSRLTSAGS